MEASKVKRKEIWHKDSLGNEDEYTLNTRIAQRKCTIPHSVMKMHCNICDVCFSDGTL